MLLIISLLFVAVINPYSLLNFKFKIFVLNSVYVAQFTKTRHNDAYLEIQIFALVSSIYLQWLYSVAIPMLYCEYFSSYKARYQEKQHISFVHIPTAINITRI